MGPNGAVTYNHGDSSRTAINRSWQGPRYNGGVSDRVVGQECLCPVLLNILVERQCKDRDRNISIMIDGRNGTWIRASEFGVVEILALNLHTYRLTNRAVEGPRYIELLTTSAKIE